MKADNVHAENEIALEMRRIYCCRGAEFARPNLERGWKEIERLEQEVSRLRAERDEQNKFIQTQQKKLDRLQDELTRTEWAKGVVQSAAADGLPWLQDGPIWKDRAESAESRLSVAMEIVKELVKLEPTREETPLQWCALCESEAVYFDETIEHKPDCLILRSQALISKEGK